MISGDCPSPNDGEPPPRPVPAPFGDGRDASGRFRNGNSGGPGNPYAKHVAALRSALTESITPEEMKQVVRRLLDLALDGNLQAIREVLDRTLGRPVEADLLVRLEHLEQALARAQGQQRR